MPRTLGLNIGRMNLRMSWNKYNLYNIRHKDAVNSLLRDRDVSSKKLYWQMQVAKRATRKYHGELLRERVFTKQLYSPKFNVVAGGEGGERLLWGGLYQGIERRLDTVIFRSLFATSIQQARQMVIHGHVEVNGKKESRPGVLLQPGDIYHANPQLVKRYISSHFHTKHNKFVNAQRDLRNKFRKLAIRARGENPAALIPDPIPLADRYEFDPYKPVHLQGTHPIFKVLDEEARQEELHHRLHEQFIPKPWMAPSVFLPAYLEVSYRSCTGCFVRKPHIKKDGLMEIPSPYAADLHERAGMYYTRFGRRADKSKTGHGPYKLFWNKRKIRT